MLEKNQAAPEFTLPNEKNEIIKLMDFKNKNRAHQNYFIKSRDLIFI